MLFALGAFIVAISGIAAFVCFIVVLIQMFQRGETGLGVATILLCFCGVGGLLAFVYGWVKSTEWNLKNVMLIWTASFVAVFVGYALLLAGGFSMFAPFGDPNLLQGY